MSQEKQKAVGDMIENGSYNPLLDIAKESLFTKALKRTMNFIYALIYFTINIPLFVVGLLAGTETAYKWWVDATYTTHINYLWFIYVWVGSIILYHLIRKAAQNMVSKEVDLIWSVNFLKKVNNRFYSMEYAQQQTMKLEEYVSCRMKEREHELLKIIDELRLIIKRLGESADFPAGIIHSLTRVVGYFTEAVLQKETNHPRYSFEYVMDHLLSEMTCIEQLHGLVNQASIMLVDEENCLRIAGSYNLHENVRRTRIIPMGKKVAGIAAATGTTVWVNDIHSEEAQEYGFEPGKIDRLPYAAVMGQPVHVIGEPYRPIGVIVLHFKDKPSFSENERLYISNTIMLYAQMVTAFIRLIPSYEFQHINHLLGGAGREVAAGSQAITKER